jgi:outer membrane protein assembly factor BamB
MGADGAIQACCGGQPAFTTLASGPILQDTTAIVGTTGNSMSSSRLFALLDSQTGCGNTVPSGTLADFGANSPAIGPDGNIYAGASQAVVAAKFDGFTLNGRATSESSRYYRGQPAFRGKQVLLATSAATVDAFTFVDPLGSPAPTPITTQAAAAGVTISSPTIAADGTAVLSTDDRHLVALRPDSSIRWTVSLPAAATAPPSHGSGDLLYLGTAAGDILALKLADGSTAWTYSAGSPIRGPLALGCDGILYAASDGAVLALVLDAAGLADSPWPKAAHDVRGTGDARRPLRSVTGSCLE